MSEAELEQLPGTRRGPAVPAGEGADSRVWGGAQDGQDPPRRTREPGGSWQFGRCRLMTGVEERDASLHPSPSMTAMGGQDDAVVCSARMVPSAGWNGSAARSAQSSNRSRVRAVPAWPSAGAPTSASRRPQASPASVGNQIAVLAQSQGGARGQAGKAVRPR